MYWRSSYAHHHRPVRPRRASGSRRGRAAACGPAGQGHRRPDGDGARLPEHLDPEAFEIAFTAVTTAADEIHEDDEAIPVCRRCGGLVGIFLSYGLHWQHFRGDGVTSGAQEIYDPGHAAEAVWLLPDEEPEEL